jgi:(2R)-ethylmalonyl-CoA mutase
LVPAIMNGLAAEGADDVVVVVGGIIPAEDEVWLIEQGVAEVFTPKDYDVAGILDRVVNHLSVGVEPVPTSP